MRRRAFGSDVRKIWSYDAAFSVDAMARRAAVLLIDERACRRVACCWLRRPLPAQLPHVCTNAQTCGFGRTERAGHFRVGNAIADNQENFAVGAAVFKPACVQSGATSPFAVLAMTVAAPADIELRPGSQLRCRGIWVNFREAGPRLTCRSLRLHCKRPTHQTVGDQKYSSHKKTIQSSPKAMRLSPIGIVTNCLPRLRKVIGLAKTRSPPLKCQSSLPVLASRA